MDKTLLDFVEARIAEDAERARRANGDRYNYRHSQARREAEAKRLIVMRCEMLLLSFEDRVHAEFPDVTRRERSHATRILENLAAVYCDHPDYDQEWA